MIEIARVDIRSLIFPTVSYRDPGRPPLIPIQIKDSSSYIDQLICFERHILKYTLNSFKT